MCAICGYNREIEAEETSDETPCSLSEESAPVRIVRRFNYHIAQCEGGWHQNICADVERSDGTIDRSSKQATLFSHDFNYKDELLDSASDLCAYLNANVESSYG